MRVTGHHGDDLDAVVDDDCCVIFDPEELDEQAPPNQNGCVMKSDVWLDLEEVR